MEDADEAIPLKRILEQFLDPLISSIEENEVRSSMQTWALDHHLNSTKTPMAEGHVQNVQLPGKDVLEHVYDVHCHPTDEIDIPDAIMGDLSIRICAMATRWEDQERVSALALRYPQKVS